MLLLRHARAGERLSSSSIDHFRQLDQQGRADARQLVWALAEIDFERVVSSPLPRCVETVIPTAESRHLVVERRNELSPDGGLEDVMALLDDLPDASLVCTHREVLALLLDDELVCEEGAGWVVEWNGALLSPTVYVPPPSTVPARYERFAHSR